MIEINKKATKSFALASEAFLYSENQGFSDCLFYLNLVRIK